jgi:hypothetical protein
MPIVDGGKFSFTLNETEYKTWMEQTLLTIPKWILVNEYTGEIKIEEAGWRLDRKGSYKWKTILRVAQFETYSIQIREKNYVNLVSGKARSTYRIEISGSITANYHGGANWKDLSFNQLQQELDKIQYYIKIDLGRLKIDNIEPCITFETPFLNVSNFINRNLISYYGNFPFNRYGKSFGRYLELSDKTEVKAYDKAMEYKLPIQLMQFELHFKKMGVVNKKGIRYLSDLRDWNKVNSLIEILTSYFDRILIFDPDVKKDDPRLTPLQRTMVERGRAREYWEDLKSSVSNGTYYNRLTEFRKLSTTYGEDYHSKIKQSFMVKWRMLMQRDCCKVLPTVKMPELETFTSTVGNRSLQLYN